jgi:methionyl aminopeptidase
MPFGKVICTSVNDAVLHGLPHDYALRDGDLVSLDFAVSIDGWVADSALSFVVGTPRDEDLAIIDTTQRALDAAIAAAAVGNRIGDISHAIAQIAHEDGYAINTDFGGHGVGHEMHGDPHVPNDGKPARGFPLREGLVIAIEPWFLQTTDKLVTDPDGWTLRSADGSRGAHSEHTIAITESGPIVLTDRSFLGVD